MKSIVQLVTELKKYFLKKTFIAPIEENATSSAAYSIGDQLIYNNILYDVTAPIAIGDTLTVGTNIAAADSITKQIAAVETLAKTDMTGATSVANGAHGLVPAPLIANRNDFLKGDGSWGQPDINSKAVLLYGATAITTATDLDTLTSIGNYYKSATNFAVTNAPDGIDSDIQATFRIIVENLLASGSSQLRQILVASTGEIYVRTNGGNAWGLWTRMIGVTSLNATLTAGSTTLTFTDDSIGNDSFIDIYSADVAPTSKAQSGHTVTLTFTAQQANLDVGLIVRNF